MSKLDNAAINEAARKAKNSLNTPSFNNALADLLKLLKPMLKNNHAYVRTGLSRDDVEQMAMIGVWKCLEGYDPARDFIPFVSKVVSRRTITANVHASLNKHNSPLNKSMSMTIPGSHDCDEDTWLVDMLEAPPEQPTTNKQIEDQSTLKELFAKLTPSLSPFELECLRAYIDEVYGLNGRPLNSRPHATDDCYGGLVERLKAKGIKANGKAVDNALMRVKRKVGTLGLSLRIEQQGDD